MINREMMENTVYTDRVLRGADGIYRWKYTLSREQALVHYRMMLKICALVCTVICVVLAVMFALEGGGPGRRYFPVSALWIFPVLYAMIVGLPALIGGLALGADTREYEMDEECIRHKHATRAGDAVICLKKVRQAEAKGNMFRLKQGITTYSVYVPEKDIAFVKDFVRKRLDTDQQNTF